MTLFYPPPNIIRSISTLYNMQYYATYAAQHSTTASNPKFQHHNGMHNWLTHNNKDGCHSRHPSLLFYVIQTI